MSWDFAPKPHLREVKEDPVSPVKKTKTSPMDNTYRDLLIECKMILERLGMYKAFEGRPHQRQLMELVERIKEVLQ